MRCLKRTSVESAILRLTKGKQIHTPTKSIRKHIKLIAAFFIVNFLSSLFAPNVAYALTSGPTAPEYTSFEPVDTTDMVNLATGDFVYNLPLLEIPGPAGGYPLSLSYHAGIMPNEEASWVGLGWTLNPGAINRTVNGYPDDQYDAIRTRNDYVDGGERHTFSLGVGVPGASFGLSVSTDTYQGFGVGSSFTLGPTIGIEGTGLGVGATATVGSDGYGNSYKGFGAGLSFNKAINGVQGLSISSALSTNFKSLSFGGGVNYKNLSIGSGGIKVSLGPVGASITSKGLRPSLSVAGISAYQHNAKANKWTVNSHGFVVPVPIPGPFILSLGYKYVRYYIDETSNVRQIGALHSDKTNKSIEEYDSWGYDAYSLPQLDIPYEEWDTEKDFGGSFPSYDHYAVSAQGLSGSIRPYTLGPFSLRKQNLESDFDSENYEIQYFTKNSAYASQNAYFKFDNDFSNKWVYDVDVLGNDDFTYDIESGNTGRNAFSKHIEYFTKKQIEDGDAKDAGLIAYPSDDQLYFMGVGDDQIGAYSITNESGVTYHYALPVYTYNEYSINQKKSNPKGEDGEIYTEYIQDTPYAYTWLLTAVTGPDFVDKNNDGLLDDDDWGYWVKFDYGRWTKDYHWRNPGEETHSDINSDYETFSHGTKQLYYLDKIETQSHVAIFEKEIRADAKGVVDLKNGGYGIQSKTAIITKAVGPITENVPVDYNNYSASSLKLNKIYLLDKEHDVSLEGLSDNYIHNFTFSGESNGVQAEIYVPIHTGENVIDKYDLDQIRTGSESYREYLTENSLRVISFDHSYDLQDGEGANGVPNSFDENGSMYVQNPNSAEDDDKLGKLTLKGLAFLGKSGSSVIPPMSFGYDKNPRFKDDHYDIWGFYKSDFDDELKVFDENLSRIVSTSSSQHVDAWSLDTITTSLGSQISVSYESDSYRKPSLLKNRVLPIKNIEANKIEFYDNINISELFNADDEIEVYMGFIHSYTIWTSSEVKDAVGVVSCVVSSVNDQPGDRHILVDSNVLDDYAVYPEDTPEYSWINYFKVGNVSVSNDSNIEGGGLRVSSVSVYSNSSTLITDYSYSDIIDENKTSGTTSYEPFGINMAVYSDNDEVRDLYEDGKNSYQGMLNNEFSKLLLISREVQAPGVTYQYVTITDEVDGEPVPGKRVYQFQPFEEGMVEHTPYSSMQGPMTLRNYTTRVGNLKSVKTYGANDALLMEQNTKYLYEEALVENANGEVDWELTNHNFRSLLDTRFDNQGIFAELYHEKKQVELTGNYPNGYTYDTRESYSLREFYPAIIYETETVNHKVGIKTSTKNLAFDLYSGEPIVTYTKDGYGNKFVNKSIPAYHFYDGMGTVIDGGKNMLTQEGHTVAYLMKDEFDPDAFSYQHVNHLDGNGGGLTSNSLFGLMSASMQTWSNGISALDGNNVTTSDNVFRKESNHSFIGYPNSSLIEKGSYIGPFTELDRDNYLAQLAQDDWQQNSLITKYDVNSHALEARDINGNYAATRFDNENQRVIATIANARYDEFTGTGFENHYDGGVTTVAGNDSGRTLEKSHTGDWSIKLMGTTPVGRALFNMDNAERGQTYKISYWTHQPNAPATLFYITDGGGDQGIIVDNRPERTVIVDGDVWKLRTATLTTPSSFTTLDIGLKYNGGTVYIDDFRVHPMDATMTSYVYNEWGELSDILDANNLFTHYEYDSMGRLKSVKRETFSSGTQKISESTIHYGGYRALTFSGSITADQISYNTTRLGVDFDAEGSNSYEVIWEVDGEVLPGNNLSQIISVTSSGYKDVVLKVTDLETGLSFMDYERENFRLCDPPGTLMSSICQTNGNGCFNGERINRYADGTCGFYEVEVSDSDCFDLNINKPECEQ